MNTHQYHPILNRPTQWNLWAIWMVTCLVAITFLTTSHLFPTQTAHAATADHGPFTIDGDMADWSERYRLDLGPHNGVVGYALYATYDPATASYLFALRAPLPISPTTALWLNTDQDPATGAGTGGAEFLVNLYPFDHQPYLYTGEGGYLAGPLPHAFSADRHILEIGVSAALLGNLSHDVDLLTVVSGTPLPTDYTRPPYTLLYTPLPERTQLEKRVAIVYSASTADNFWGGNQHKAYAQLYASVQHQVMMAGIPYDLIHEEALADYTNLIEYDALILPAYSHVDMDVLVPSDFDTLTQLENSLNRIVYNYGIGLITAGDLMTNDRNGVPISVNTYRRQENLLGLHLTMWGGPTTYTLQAADISHPVMGDYTADELLITYPNGYYSAYGPFLSQPVDTLASIIVAGVPYNGMVATQTGGRNIHFGTPQWLADRNLLWRAVQWVVYGEEMAVELQLGRFASLFVSRNDMDQSQFVDEVPQVIGPLYTDYLVDWKNNYNFVGSFYLNIGADLPPDDPACYVGAPLVANPTYPGSLACTDWDLSRPLYLDYLALGHEIGSHSYTHLPATLYPTSPDSLDGLTPAERLFELRDSMDVLASGLSIPIVGVAQPGNPEALFVVEELDSAGYMDYFSGGYSSVGAGFPSAFGYLSPDHSTVYLAPNMTFDFTMIGYWGWTPAQAEAHWQTEFAHLTTHGSQPIVHWPWHDYSLTQELGSYSEAMYTSLLNTAYTADTEFTTAADTAERIAAFRTASLTTSDLSASGEITATVAGSNLGRGSLKLETGGQQIAHVDGWYAYHGDHIFLPPNGGTFRAQLGSTADSVTHITHLPMRAELVSLVGDGTELTYTFNGQGAVILELNIPENGQLQHEGADSVALVGNTFTMLFDSDGPHTGRVYFELLPRLAFSHAGYSANEQSAEVTITVTLDTPATRPVSVTVASVDGTAVAGEDFAAVNQTVAWAIGQTSQPITIALVPDGVVEGSESFSLTLSSPHNGVLGTPHAAVVTIADMPVDLSGDGAAWHHLSGIYLGSELSADAAPTTAGDDGAIRTPHQRWAAGETPTITVTVGGSGAGWLVVWLDWGDGLGLAEATAEMAISQSVVGGQSYPLQLTVPPEYVTGTLVQVRVRVYEVAPTAASPVGYGGGGEVEDFLWQFTPTAVALRHMQATQPQDRFGWVLVGVLVLAVASVGVVRRGDW